jgi:hypothetical protein
MKNITIERWDVIDLRFEPTAIIPAPAAKLLCNNDSKQAKYMYIPSSDKTKSLDTPKLYCLKCSEKSKYKIPSREIMPIKRNFALLQKKKMDELIDIHNMVVVPASATSAASTATDDNNKKIRKADKIKEIVHIDGTARAQTLNFRDNPFGYNLVKSFFDKTGIPILINTSFNNRGKSILSTISEALEILENTDIDHVWIEGYLFNNKKNI